MSDLVNGVMQYLDYPTPRQLSGATILSFLYDKMDAYRARLNLSAQDWLMERFPFTVQPNVDDFLVTATTGAAPSVGRWVIAFTDDPAGSFGPNWHRDEVPVVSLQDIQRHYDGPVQDLAGASYPWVARCFAFWTEGGQLKGRVAPRHSVPANYVIFYEPDRPTPPRLNQAYPLLQSFVNVVKVDLAITCLPALAVKDSKTGEILNPNFIQLKQGILQRDFEQYNGIFEEYRSQAIQDHIGPRLGWGSDQDLYEDSGWPYAF